MSRVIQESVKKPLAEEVLFGKLKDGGHVRVIMREEDGKPELAFEYPEGPVTPKPEKDVAKRGKTTRKVKKGDNPGDAGPKTPLVNV
jgi:ATP-dependent Clp protease ATP-binding subunit ClpA